jgi:5,10-methylenetetrahydrofolate reductase
MNKHFSFEFFPPKTDAGADKLRDVYTTLAASSPNIFRSPMARAALPVTAPWAPCWKSSASPVARGTAPVLHRRHQG